MKKLSAGIIIINEYDEFLLGHSTGNVFFDIFKGSTELNETPIQTALRECQEESGLQFNEADIKDLGIFSYNKEKDLHLFLCRVNKLDIDLIKLKCSTFVELPTYSFPEMDRFAWFNIKGLLLNTASSMNKVFKKIVMENIIELKNIPENIADIPNAQECAKINKANKIK